MEINGKQVVDATKKAAIKITERDVNEGKNKDPAACAAARAAKRDVSNCISARVHIGRVYIEQKDKWVRYETPKSLRTEIIAFDRGGSFEPGEYVLEIPQPSTQRARSGSDTNRNRHWKTKEPRKTLKIARVKRHSVTGIRPRGANR